MRGNGGSKTRQLVCGSLQKHFSRERPINGRATRPSTGRSVHSVQESSCSCCADLSELRSKPAVGHTVPMKTEDRWQQCQKAGVHFLSAQTRGQFPCGRPKSLDNNLLGSLRIYLVSALSPISESLFFESTRSLVSWQQDCRFTYRSRGRNLLSGGK